MFFDKCRFFLHTNGNRGFFQINHAQTRLWNSLVDCVFPYTIVWFRWKNIWILMICIRLRKMELVIFLFFFLFRFFYTTNRHEWYRVPKASIVNHGSSFLFNKIGGLYAALECVYLRTYPAIIYFDDFLYTQITPGRQTILLILS